MAGQTPLDPDALHSNRPLLPNMVEIFFGIITRQAIRRGSYTSVTDLETATDTYIQAYDDRCEPFSWTKTADQILNKIKP